MWYRLIIYNVIFFLLNKYAEFCKTVFLLHYYVVLNVDLCGVKNFIKMLLAESCNRTKCEKVNGSEYFMNALYFSKLTPIKKKTQKGIIMSIFFTFQLFHRCVQSWHNEPFFSLYPFSLSVVLIWKNRGNMDFVSLPLMCLIEIPANPTVKQPLPGDAPLGPAVYPGEESTHSERCPPKLASHRAWETGMFPSPCSSAQGLHPRESSHHSLSAIHKQPHPQPLHSSHTCLLPPALSCISATTFLYFTPHLLLYWHFT